MMRCCNRFKNPGSVPVVFMAMCVAVFVALGGWQLQRLQWKQEILDRTKAGQEEAPLAALPGSAGQLQEVMYRRVALAGYYLKDKVFFRIGMHPDYAQGYYILQPFRILDTDQTILVNRGFVPGTQQEALDIIRSAKGAAPSQVQGLLRPPHEARLFTPANQPDRNIWFSDALREMGDTAGVTLLPAVVERTGKIVANQFPIPNKGEIRLRNDHLGYAVTWFLLAAIAVIMFYFYGCRKAEEAEAAIAAKPKTTRKPTARKKKNIKG